MKVDHDFDERYFVNQSGLIHAPIKLISPLEYPKANPHIQAPQFSERQDIINTANNKRQRSEQDEVTIGKSEESQRNVF